MNNDKTLNGKLPSLSVEDGIAIVTLRDPATLNGLSWETFSRLGEIFGELTERAGHELRAVVLTGSGRGFCAGAEIGSVFRSIPAGVSVGRHIHRMTSEVATPAMMAIHRCPLPLVVAVNGVAAGIGMSIALMGDIVLAARSACFTVPFMTGLGIVPDGGLTWQLPRLVGHARANALCLLGDRISAEQAVEFGLIWRCVDDAKLMEDAIVTARRLARLPAYACGELRAALKHSGNSDYEAQYHYELERNEELLNGADFSEGLSAFVEKRTPRFPS